jgi:hypothetical protein
VGEQRRKGEQQHPGDAAGSGLEGDGSKHNLAQAFWTARRGIGNEANGRSTETEVEHASSFCHRPGKS